jgi:hypothetical protein
VVPSGASPLIILEEPTAKQVSHKLLARMAQVCAQDDDAGAVGITQSDFVPCRDLELFRTLKRLGRERETRFLVRPPAKRGPT